ncbi:hypothetical protein CERZMDRAFT_51399 [Cercospora zeae-maydis SCOH1-5]|uniref:TEA domain-containing protein n=1 Tax=Cercospora zeae-maydis SCOH1-5 TaxID=717836 RepID=A0A6A6F0M1_9PEZI|nr:hypothetical protein CERZMDRAFT_51399 [Cercospora zeae-maydis SCOH1-5]
MLQPTAVLPSNAPLHHQESSNRSSRVLQEQSGNRQQDYYAATVDQKHPTPYLTENTYPAYQHIPRPLHTTSHTLLQHNRLRHPQHRFHHGQRDHEQIRKEARYLFQRFRSSDGYMQYRNRQHKKDKESADQIWPDRLEYAFFEALVHWPPMARRQLPHKDKQRGRNELIADYIEEHTGETRSRKQVSSHIQVLKHFVEHDPHIMRYFSKEDLSGRAPRYYTQGSGYYSTGGRRASQYPATGPSSYSTRSSLAGGAPSMEPASLYHTLPQIKDNLSVFQPISFEMFVQRNAPGLEMERMHTYTKNLATPLKDEVHPTWEEFASEFPSLAALQCSSRPIDCNVLFAEASIAFPSGTWKDKTNVELGISLSCSSQRLPPDSSVFCSNGFYEKGVLQKGYRDPVPWDGWTEEQDGTGRVDMLIKFGSSFWAMKLGTLANKLKSFPMSSLDGAGEMVAEPRGDREMIDQELRDTTALQEIVIDLPDGTRQRLLLIYWKFRLSRAEEGRAYWRPLVVPTPDLVKSEATQTHRVDSVIEYSDLPTYGADAYGSTTRQQPAALQSPFKYDASSSSGSALNSAVWSSSNGFDTNDGTNTAPNSAVELFPPATDNNFDFTGGNINISYNNNMDFSAFDASAFDFGASATTDFVTDPALENYGTQNFSQQDFDPQCTEQHDPYNFDLDVPVTCGVEPQSTTVTYNNYSTTPYDSQQYSQQYAISPADSQQAYGGAGQEVATKEEQDPLAALADASGYMAHTRHPHHQHDHSPRDVVQTREGSEGYNIYDFQHQQQYHPS